MFAGMLILLFIGSTNYNLSLGFALTFVLAACAIIDMHMTFRNLAHLHLLAGTAQPVFAGEEASFELRVINRRSHDRYAIWIGFIGLDYPTPQQAIDVGSNASRDIKLSMPTVERGWMQAPRIRLQTRFPLGLLRAWSYWQPDARVLVYPFPEPIAPPLPLSGDTKKDSHGHAGHDDFGGIRGYQSGDSIKHLAWRQIAKVDLASGGQLVTKHFEGGAGGDLCLDFSKLPRTLDVEMKLSRMARWIVDAEQHGLPYSFRLADITFPAAIGPAHRHACLQALALY